MSALSGPTGHTPPFRTGFLAPFEQKKPEELEEQARVLAEQVPLPFFEREDLLTIVAELLYIQHGGSGMQLSYPAVMDMELSEILWWRQKLYDKRQEEVEALKRG